MPCDACSLLALKRWLPIALHTDGGHDERRQGVDEDTGNFLPSTSAVNACNYSSRFVYPSSSSSPFGLAGNINFLVFFSRTGQPPALLSGSGHSGLPLTADTLSISPPTSTNLINNACIYGISVRGAEGASPGEWADHGRSKKRKVQ